MPFTLAHPAAILPFHRARNHRLRLAALAIGAMTPDAEFLLGVTRDGWFSHTLPGIVLVCVPLGWACLWLFDRWGRRGLERLLPDEWVLPPAPASGFWWITASLVIGAATHVVWDAFTHESQWGFHVLTGLRGSFVPGWRPGLPGFKLLQDGSSVLGLAVLGWAGVRWARTQPRASWRRPAWRGLTLLALLAVVGFADGLSATHGWFFGGHEREVLSVGGMGVILALGASLVVLGMGSPPRARW